MNRKIVWLLLSCFMVVALLLASCGPAEEEEEVVTPPEEKEVAQSEEEAVAPEGKEMVQDSFGRLVEKPKYGGWYIWTTSQGPTQFDESFSLSVYSWTLSITNDELWSEPWEKGPAGTGEVTHLYSLFTDPFTMKGEIAESFELSDPDTLVYHIRKGIHFHDKPPTNGREVNADDVVYSLRRCWGTAGCYHQTTYPVLADMENLEESIYASDEWTVVVKCAPGQAGVIFEMASDMTKIIPHEVIEQYGNMNDWRVSCGTGAFMLTDYVDQSSLTFVRNPNYWQDDPIHPGNRLPYLDGTKCLIIPDSSTRLSAMRTGKIDHLGLGWESAGEITKTNPELKYVKWLVANFGVPMWRLDKPELPFYDIRVRRALCMAIDRQAMIDGLHGGDAELLMWPVMPILELEDVYIPLEELPESTRELYEYHPDKAKQLLAEAGYPDGFQTEIICTSGYVDTLSILKDYWAKVGVDLEIQVKDYPVYVSIGSRKTHKQMYLNDRVAGNLPFKFMYTRLNYFNHSMCDDPQLKEVYEAVTAAYFDWDEKCRLVREAIPYMLDQAYFMFFPVGYTYTFWQPWVKGYHGEYLVGYYDLYQYIQYMWIDQDLKEEMTGSR